MKESSTTSSISIDWKMKLTSRKFWVSVIGFVTPLLVAFGMSDNQVAEITAIIMSGAQLIAYVIGEGLIDATRISANKTITTTTTTSVTQKEECATSEPDSKQT